VDLGAKEDEREKVWDSSKLFPLRGCPSQLPSSIPFPRQPRRVEVNASRDTDRILSRPADWKAVNDYHAA
jgi:hypothetical protein